MLSAIDIELAIFTVVAIACMAYPFYCWKTPLSRLNYIKILGRVRLKAAESRDDAISVGRIFYCRSRYVELRTSFLAMKMGYRPTDEKIDRLISILNAKRESPLNKNWKSVINEDIDILTRIKSQISEGSFVVDTFRPADHDPNKHIIELPIRFVLVIAVLGSIFDVFMMPFIITGNIAIFHRFQPIATPFVVICAENVLRRSRNESERRIAYIAQAVSVAAFVTFFLVVLLMALGIFDFKQLADYLPDWFRL